MIYADITNGIWSEKNQRIFEKRRKPWETIAREIIYVSCVRAPPRTSMLVHDNTICIRGAN
ncbi:hypothetical protein H5410_030265 [Solanum commersonii]|uniref:Uncharacterized protein n=1 Tax=Solanum commersonii TaxID=4109 RepID=A0A9J5YGC7_SOLCO|nr:hypothetical protein H5410_030265 [Solanum commersonii]